MPVSPLGFSAQDVMRAVLDSQPRDPYHENPGPNGWVWHASSLGFGCLRRAVLERACKTTGAVPLDPRPLDGEMTMLVGTLWHKEVERGIRHLPVLATGDVKVLYVEEPFYHKGIPLVAKPDGVLEVNGKAVVYDLKTEHERSAQWRSSEARDEGRHTTAKPEHQLQVAAQALCLESNDVGPVEQGFVFYISKNSGWLEIAPVDLSESVLRLQVEHRVAALEAAWAAFAQGSKEDRIVLPPRLPGAEEAGKDGKPWQCRRTSAGGGRYCPVASFCLDRRLDQPA